jgi:hypothetical protein
MNIPGFTANTALYNTRGRYLAIAGIPAPSANWHIVPQLPRQLELLFCLGNCSDSACKQTCFQMYDIRTTDDQFPGGGNGGGGGGGIPHCRAQCSPCGPDSTSETGRSRNCLTFDCDLNTIPC